MIPFQPRPASTVSIAATTASANVAINGVKVGGQVRVTASGADARIEFGSSNAVAAAATSLLVRGGSVEVLTAPSGTTYVAAKTDASTSTVEFTPGMGV